MPSQKSSNEMQYQNTALVEYPGKPLQMPGHLQDCEADVKVQGNSDVNTSDLLPGLYILRVVGGGPNDFKKIMIMDHR